MKQFSSTFNCKVLYLIILIVCRKYCSQSDCMDCKTITIEGEEKVSGRVPKLLSMLWNSIEIR